MLNFIVYFEIASKLKSKVNSWYVMLILDKTRDGAAFGKLLIHCLLKFSERTSKKVRVFK